MTDETAGQARGPTGRGWLCCCCSMPGAVRGTLQYKLWFKKVWVFIKLYDESFEVFFVENSYFCAIDLQLCGWALWDLGGF